MKNLALAKSERFGQLEALRGFAALYVVAHHVWMALSPDIQTSPLRWVLKHGMLAVTVFFVLSGFVIEHSTATGSINNFNVYFRKRFARIYPLFVIALVISYLVGSAQAGHLIGLDIRNLFGNLLMLQGTEVSPGRWFVPYAGNGPAWSLTYEWWFYMMYYPIRKLLAERYQALFVAGLSVVGLITNYFVKANQISMILTLFVIWWLGVELARGRLREGRTALYQIRTPLLASIALAAALLMLSVSLRESLAALAQVAHYQLTSFVYMFLVVAVGFLWKQIDFAGFKSLFGPFEAVAPISYSIYILHVPVVGMGAQLFPNGPPLLVYGALFVVLGLLCYALEGRLQKKMSRLLVPQPRRGLARSAAAG